MHRVILSLLFAVGFVATASAQCAGPGGVPFNCLIGSAPQPQDLILGGSNTGSQAGRTVRWTVQQFLAASTPTVNWASPPPIGNVVPNTGAFTTLNASGTISGNAFAMAADQNFSFNGASGTRTLGYVSADAALEYKVGSTNVWKIADTGLVTGYRGIAATGFLVNGNILSASSNLVGATGSTLAQNFSSVIGSATGALTANSYVYNLIQMQSDNLNVGSAANSEAVLLGIYDGFGGTSVSGARTAAAYLADDDGSDE